ncbi:MAG TPA: hypothetical protein VGK66_03805 [Solirubrobacterales bacterium]
MLTTALTAALAIAPAAQASFHLIKVREIYADGADDSYVELQMYAAGQTFLANHAMTVYDASGTLVHSSKFASGVTNGQNQATVLIGDTGVQAKFGIAPDLVDAELTIPASGGAVCWNAGGLPADCVAWGNFSGGSALQTATGTTVGSPVSPSGITAGKAIRRSIAPGCSTLLEESDDSNNSVTDFVEVTPAPRNNTSPITETTCPGSPPPVTEEEPPGSTPTPTPTPESETPPSSPGPAGNSGGGTSPNPGAPVAATTLAFVKKPPAKTKDRTPTFRFRSDPPGASFRCAVDRGPFRACRSPFTPKKPLSLGPHKLRIQTTELGGPTLSVRFRIVRGAK